MRPPSLRIKERALRRSAPLRAEPDAGARLILSPSDQLVADEDRSRAELVLRENFGHGRLTLEELTTRVAAVHDAQTIGQLHAALSGLPDGP